MPYAGLLALWLLLMMVGAQTAAETLPEATPPDLSKVASLADRRHQPVLLVVTDQECPYCFRLEQEVLRPMRQRGELEAHAIVREMRLNTSGKLVDFDGERVRARVFLNRYQVFAVPTVLFLDQRGKPLHEPLVGFNGQELYRPLLEEALQESTSLLHGLSTSAQGTTMAEAPHNR